MPARFYTRGTAVNLPRPQAGAALGAGWRGRHLTLLRRSDTCGLRAPSGRGTERQQLPAAQRAALLPPHKQQTSGHRLSEPVCLPALEGSKARPYAARAKGRADPQHAARPEEPHSARPHPPPAAISRPQGGPTAARSPRAHLPTRGAPPPWGSRPSRRGRGGRGGAGRGEAAAQRGRPPGGGRRGSAFSWAAAPGRAWWLRAAHAEPEVTRLHPDSPAGHRGRSRRPQQKDEETFRREKTNRFSLKQFARE